MQSHSEVLRIRASTYESQGPNLVRESSSLLFSRQACFSSLVSSQHLERHSLCSRPLIIPLSWFLGVSHQPFKVKTHFLFPLSLCSQLVLTVGLLAVVVYLYTVVAFNFFRKFYNKSEDEDEPDMKCDDMMTVSSTPPRSWICYQPSLTLSFPICKGG